VIGPKDLPRALRMAGSWLAKIRRVSGHFRSGIEEMIRQAELEDMEQKWKEKNAAIMAEQAANHAAFEPGSEAGEAGSSAGPVAGVESYHLPAAAEAGLAPYPAEPYGEASPPAYVPADTSAPVAPAPASPAPAHDQASPELPLTASPKPQP
jgi:sec-independent protein translocase protein TatB